MNCPICGKVAKTTHGLRQHLIGTRPYGGHELLPEEAAYVVAAATASPSDPNGTDAFLRAALDRLTANKKLPKYEFERAVDAFLGVFLPDIVGGLLRVRGVKLAAQEFPLKKSRSNQSTNVDYVFHIPDRHGGRWLFLELKTDMKSLNRGQAMTYADRLVGATMEHLLSDVEIIAQATKAKSKYQALLMRFAPYRPAGGPTMLAYLSPQRVSAAELLPEGAPVEKSDAFEQALISWTFEQVSQIEVDNYPAAWDAFRDRVIPSLMLRQIRGRNPARVMLRGA